MNVTRRAVVWTVVALALPVVARAQVDCSNPDNLCTGDPCVIPAVLVANPCVVGFGARTVVIAGTLRVPSDGVLSFTAGALQVQAPIRNQPGDGQPDVSFAATGAIDVAGPVRLTDKFGARLTISAGGALSVTRSIVLSGKYAGPGITGITLDAGGDVTIEAALRTTTKFSIPPPFRCPQGARSRSMHPCAYEPSTAPEAAPRLLAGTRASSSCDP